MCSAAEYGCRIWSIGSGPDRSITGWLGGSGSPVVVVVSSRMWSRYPVRPLSKRAADAPVRWPRAGAARLGA